MKAVVSAEIFFAKTYHLSNVIEKKEKKFLFKYNNFNYLRNYMAVLLDIRNPTPE